MSPSSMMNVKDLPWVLAGLEATEHSRQQTQHTQRR